MKRKMFAILSIAVTLVFCMSLTFNSLAVTESDKKNLQDKINQAKDELSDIQDSKSDAQSELESLTIQVQEAENELASLKARVSELNDSIQEKQDEITKGEEEIKEKEELLRKRMVAMYKLGDTSYLDVLLASENLFDFLSRYSMIQSIAKYDTNAINELEKKKEALEKDKAELEADKQEVETVKAEQEKKSIELTDLKNKKQKEVDSLSDEEKKKQEDIDSYNAAMVKVNEELQRAWEKAQEEIKKNNGGSSNGSSGLKFDGSFIWPCNNKIVTSTVKNRWGRKHKGIDIGARYESVYASASGYAYNAYDRNGYGTYIMIFHGSGYVSLYGHLNSSHVSNGQYVSQGQVIATSGNSGGSTGPHLHFELRQATSISQFFSKSPLNPLDYLPGGYTLAAGATTES